MNSSISTTHTSHHTLKKIGVETIFAFNFHRNLMINYKKWQITQTASFLVKHTPIIVLFTISEVIFYSVCVSSSLQWTSGWSLKTQTRTISSRLRSVTLRAVNFATRKNGRTVSVFCCSSCPTSSSGSSARKYKQHACYANSVLVNVLSQSIYVQNATRVNFDILYALYNVFLYAQGNPG